MRCDMHAELLTVHKANRSARTLEAGHGYGFIGVSEIRSARPGPARPGLAWVCLGPGHCSGLGSRNRGKLPPAHVETWCAYEYEYHIQSYRTHTSTVLYSYCLGVWPGFGRPLGLAALLCSAPQQPEQQVIVVVRCEGTALAGLSQFGALGTGEAGWREFHSEFQQAARALA